MAVALSPDEILADTLAEPRRKRWTRDEVKALEQIELFAGKRYELIEGELIDKMGKSRNHTIALREILGWLESVFGRLFIQHEANIDIAQLDNASNEPEPDIVVTRRSYRSLRAGNPKPEDIALVVEISESSLALDLHAKAELYARAGITDYWVVDCRRHRLIVHRDPQDGVYQSKMIYAETECVAPLAAPAQEFPVGAAFPAESE